MPTIKIYTGPGDSYEPHEVAEGESFPEHLAGLTLVYAGDGDFYCHVCAPLPEMTLTAIPIYNDSHASAIDCAHCGTTIIGDHANDS